MMGWLLAAAILADSAGRAAVPHARGENASLSRYLLSAREDAVLMARNSGPSPATGSYTGLPFLRDMEFRLRNDALDPANLRYTLRVEPRGFGEGRASRLYNEAEVRRSRYRDRLLLNRAMLDRYLLAVDCLMWASFHRINVEHMAVLVDRIRVLERLKTTEKFEITDLIEAEADLTKLKSQDLDVQKDLDVLQQRIGLQMGNGQEVNGDRAGDGKTAEFASFDTTGLVSVDSITAEVEKGHYSLDTSHVYLQYLKQNLALAENRYRMEQASGRQYLSHLSFSYDMGERLNELERRDAGKDYDLGRAYILEVGFRLPFLTEGMQDINHRKEQLLSEKEDYAQRRRELEDIMRKDLRDIRSLVIHHRYLSARENEVDAQSSLKKYMQMPGVDPLALLAIKSGQLRNRFKLEEVRFGIIKNWIKVLDAAGELTREPLRNFLIAGAPELPL